MLSPLVAGEPSIADVLEQTTQRYRAVLTDDEGNPVPVAALTLFTISLYVITAGGAIHYIRQDQSVINANNGTIDASGVFLFQFQAADTTLVDPSLPFERHVALFKWATATQIGKHELILVVKNLAAVA